MPQPLSYLSFFIYSAPPPPPPTHLRSLPTWPNVAAFVSRDEIFQASRFLKDSIPQSVRTSLGSKKKHVRRGGEREGEGEGERGEERKGEVERDVDKDVDINKVKDWEIYR